MIIRCHKNSTWQIKWIYMARYTSSAIVQVLSSRPWMTNEMMVCAFCQKSLDLTCLTIVVRHLSTEASSCAACRRSSVSASVSSSCCLEALAAAASACCRHSASARLNSSAAASCCCLTSCFRRASATSPLRIAASSAYAQMQDGTIAPLLLILKR